MTATTALASVERGVLKGDPSSIRPAAWELLSLSELTVAVEFLAVRVASRMHGGPDPLAWARQSRVRLESVESLMESATGLCLTAETGAVGQASSGTVQIDGGTLLEMQPRAESRNPDAACSLAALAFRDLLRQKHGHSALGADLIAGAFLEMVDNAIEHSESSVPIWASCQVLPLGWSFSVTDVGCGVVKSLSRNPKYASVDHGAKALGLALEDGVSGVAKAGRGHGFSRLFKCLADRQCHLRCRSDAAAIDWRGVSPTDQQVQVLISPRRQGFHVAVGADGGRRRSRP